MAKISKVNGKVLWHIRNGKARVINFKGILTREEIITKYSAAVEGEYYRGKRGPACYLVLGVHRGDVPYISLRDISRNTVENTDGKPSDIYARKLTIPENLSGFQKYVTIWEELSIEEMKFVDDVVSRANDHLNELIGIYLHPNEQER
jgi:hypothetical protein